MTQWRRVCLALALTTSACGPDPVDYPTPPMAEETEAIVATYETPTGTVDETEIDEVAARVRTRLDELDISWLPEVMSRVLVRLRRRFEAGSLPADPAAAEDSDRARVKAVVTIQQVCSGWSDPPGPPNASENGSVELTAIVDHTQLRRALWGEATDCRWRITPTIGLAQVVTGPALNAILDGTLILYLEAPLPEEITDAAFFMRFSGEVGRQELVRQLSFDFRVINGQLEIRQAVDDGDVIVAVGPETFSVRGQNATYTCDLETLACN